MTLIEALKTKKIFKRGPLTFHPDLIQAKETWTFDEITADDYELIYPKTEITKRDFFLAVAETLKELGLDFYGPHGIHKPLPGDVMNMKDWSLLADKLGLKDAE